MENKLREISLFPGSSIASNRRYAVFGFRWIALMLGAEKALLPTKRTESGRTMLSQALLLNASLPMYYTPPRSMNFIFFAPAKA